MIPTKAESAWRGTADCKECCIRDMTLFADLNAHDFSLIHGPIDKLEYPAGACLFTEGGAAKCLFTLRYGMLKLVRSTIDGRPRIVGVLRAGDVAGLEALAGTPYDCDAVALTPVSVCRIPQAVIQTLSSSSPRLQTQLMKKWQHALKDADDWLADMNFGTARRRVGNLILKMRSAENSEIAELFSREDMGAMLDLKLETVSREISLLVRNGVIEQLDKRGRTYRVIHSDKLITG